MKIIHLQPNQFHLLQQFKSRDSIDFWSTEAEIFLVSTVPTQLEPARGTQVSLIVRNDGEVIAAAGYREHHALEAIHLQVFLMCPPARNKGIAVQSLTMFCNQLAKRTTDKPYVVWSVRTQNVAMLKTSSKVGTQIGSSPDLTHFVFERKNLGPEK